MTGCCCNENDIAGRPLQARQKRMLWAVLFVNAAMFAVEFGAGLLGGSTALLGDSLDMLGDAMVYTLSLVVIAKNTRWKAVSAAFKGAVMLVFGVLVLIEAAHKAAVGAAPASIWMMAIGSVALLANAFCLYLLTRHREDDVNMRSAWVCSRNDLIANAGVIVAGVAVYATQSVWPDVIVGTAIAVLFVQSAIGVLRDAWQRYRACSPVKQAARVGRR